MSCIFLNLNICGNLSEVLIKNIGNYILPLGNFFQLSLFEILREMLDSSTVKNPLLLFQQPTSLKGEHVDCFTFEVEKLYASTF